MPNPPSQGLDWSRKAVDLDKQSLHKEAQVFWKKLLAIKVELFGRRDFRTCSTLRYYGESLARGGDVEEGKKLILEAIQHLEEQRHGEASLARDALNDVLKLERLGSASAEEKAHAQEASLVMQRTCGYTFCNKMGT